MKCEVCLELLEEYLDGELLGPEPEQIGEHLITCTTCAGVFGALTAEQELFGRYDREIAVPPFLWTRVAAHTVSANSAATSGWRRLAPKIFTTPSGVATVAALSIAVAVGLVSMAHRPSETVEVTKVPDRGPVSGARLEVKALPVATHGSSKRESLAGRPRPTLKVRPRSGHPTPDQSDVLSSDLAYLDIEEQDTAKHLEQTQNLLRSIRNFPLSDGDEEIDVTYDKALSRRLLNENVVLRREAEMKAKFPTKTLLADLEPFLIDIANLPDRARPEEVRVIKERVRRTEIVAALVDYQDQGANNR